MERSWSTMLPIIPFISFKLAQKVLKQLKQSMNLRDLPKIVEFKLDNITLTIRFLMNKPFERDAYLLVKHRVFVALTLITKMAQQNDA